jgi:NADH dehydrogenase
MALVGGKPRNASVRAKTAVEVVVIGKDVFTQISSSLGPLRDLISEAVKERRARQ